MDDFDGALPSRLAALAEAVPVEPRRSPADVRPGGVVLGRTSRRVAPTTLTAILAIGATGVLIAGVLRVGPFGPAASSTAAPTSDSTAVSPELPLPSPTDGPPVGRDSEGPYSVEIRSGRRVYRQSEPIDIAAVFTHSGDRSVSVSADAFFPLSFGIREPVHGLTIFADRAVPLISRPGCRSVVLQPGDERRSKFTITGFGPSPPNEEQRAFLADPELHLPPGTWHFVVESSVMGVGPCADATGAPAAIRSPDVTLSAEIEIEVVASPGPPQPTPFLNKPVYGGDDIGDFTLQLKVGNSTYVAGSPIDVSAWYTYGSGIGNTVTVSHFAPEVAFSISQVADDATPIRSMIYDSACQELTLLDGRERHVGITDNNVMTITAASWPPSTAAALKDGILQLPVGRWRITAVVQTTLGPCNAPGEARQLHASIEIDVVSTIPGATDGPDEPTPSSAAPPSPEATGATDTVTANVATGTFELGISAPSVVVANGSFAIATTYAYLGPLDQTVVSAFYPVPTFKIIQLDATSPTGFRSFITDSACRGWTMARNVAVAGGLGFISEVSGDGVDKDWLTSHVDGAELRLPAGIWRITASVSEYFAPECAGSQQTIEASIVLPVLSMTPVN